MTITGGSGQCPTGRTFCVGLHLIRRLQAYPLAFNRGHSLESSRSPRAESVISIEATAETYSMVGRSLP